ncbi:DUF4260 domain-containing protein [Siphonobacter sp. SORGH_AS_1065]|uniref:DUF4260 domain-containing protein n=1 Tax=Siphonobacter sp. SORGH_AS_1065 TaxID=3041795 RepID=UPI002785CFEC|nr:DUF4260 domain-containing protein [Siphonobacter sp. SORGH_AS_1065]MDQ1086537.1 hypothetical protein [Siphonobacter sp. SORGH_AS_1065]
MKTLIKIEEAAQVILSLVLFAQLPFAWWLFPVLLLVPDVSMVGYVFNSKTGAFIYNVFHHKAVAILIGVLGFYLGNEYVLLAGIILFGHSSMDRMFGYGLKFDTGFGYTHLGEIGDLKK